MFPDIIAIFVPVGPCATGPAEERIRTGHTFLEARKPFGMSEKPIIGRYARILLDDWFKRPFGTENRKRLLLLFLQELIPEHKIVNLTYANTEHINPFPGKKDVRIDVECTDQDGTRFIVEVQVAPQKHFRERAVINSSFAIQHKDADRVDYRYMLRENTTGEIMTSRIQYIFLELPNSQNKALTEKATVLDNFCYALHQMEHLTERPSGLKQEIFRLLFDSAEITKFTPEEKAKYQQDMTTERDIRNFITFAREEGMEKGREETRKLVTERLRERGFSEEEIQSILADKES